MEGPLAALDNWIRPAVGGRAEGTPEAPVECASDRVVQPGLRVCSAPATRRGRVADQPTAGVTAVGGVGYRLFHSEVVLLCLLRLSVWNQAVPNYQLAGAR